MKDNSLRTIFEISRNPLNSRRTVNVRGMKTMEELGEFSEAILSEQGELPHKMMKEPVAGEAADVIMCVLDTLAGVYPDKSIDELLDMINSQFEIKCAKWKRIMVENSKFYTNGK